MSKVAVQYFCDPRVAPVVQYNTDCFLTWLIDVILQDWMRKMQAAKDG